MPEGKHPRLYAVSAEGHDLPVLDITDPALELELDPAKLTPEIERFIAEETRRQKTPAWVTKLMLAIFAHQSYLIKAMSGARAGYLPGLTTYYLKLGATNLPPLLDNAIDRQIAGSLAARSTRLRLEQVAKLLAEALSARLSPRPRVPLRLLNIAGGPAMDSLNALILLAGTRRDLLTDRRLSIDILDIDTVGPGFARSALTALQADGQILNGLDIELRHISWNWRDLAQLKTLLEDSKAKGAIVAVSSEGGLFEYGSDAEIIDVLKTLRSGLGGDAIFAGSVTRGDAATQLFRKASPFPIVPRGLDLFAALIATAGWEISESRQAAFSDQVLLRPLA